MKKHLLIALMFCLAITITDTDAQVKIGVKGGLNISSIAFEGPYEIDVSPLASFHLGGFFNYALSDNFGLQAELMYSGQGAKYEATYVINGVTVDVDAKRKLNYLSLPFLGRYHFSNGIALEAGLGLDFLLAAKESYDTSLDFQGLGFEDQDVKEYHLGADLKFIIGAGYELPSGLSFNVRYNAGLSNNLDEDHEEYLEGEELINSVFQLGVGFPLYGN